MELDILTTATQGGPTWVLLFILWQEIKTLGRKMDEMVEGIAYWGKRQAEK